MKHSASVLKISSLIIFLILIIIFFPKIIQYYQNTESLLKASGILSPIIYMLLMIIAILVVPIPSSPLAILAGTIFGPFKGMIYTLISASIGAVIAFLFARFFFRDYFAKKLENNHIYKKIKGKDNKNITQIVFLTRLMPQISFDLVSYAAGITGIKIAPFTIATFLGMIPMVFLLSFFGYLIAPYLLYFLTFLIILFIAYMVYKIVKVKKN